ncbi:MAG: methyltransferase domain-containing protein, partial [Nanoarchaeota archaeon]|nr:methyltransferase domain-containing protein [Nanoarchaeota archaeon]
GKFARRLKEFGANVYALDTSQRAIDEAIRIGDVGIKYRHIKSGDLSSVPELDFATINFVLCCVQDNEEIAEILRKIYEKLPQEGILVVCEPHPDGVNHEFVSYRSTGKVPLKSGDKVRVELDGLSKKFCDCWRPKKETLELIAQAGFFVERVKEPLADPEEFFWKDEKTQVPYLIVKAVK